MGMSRIPPVVLIYGLLGLIPFLAPVWLGTMFPAQAGFAAQVLAVYGAVILSFLGGARWGFAVIENRPDPVTVSLAMLPSVAGLGLMLMPDAVRLPGLAGALAAHWLWDLRSTGLPGWYPALRSILTAGATAGLIAGAVLLP